MKELFKVDAMIAEKVVLIKKIMLKGIKIYKNN
jgi:hypothetical protein